jgi:hypothetical protein
MLQDISFCVIDHLSLWINFEEKFFVFMKQWPSKTKMWVEKKSLKRIITDLE